MGDLAVTVTLHGRVVEHRVVPVRCMVRLGEAPDARVAFPGADLAAVRMGDRISLRGRSLEEGDSLCMSLGAVGVTIEHTIRSHIASEWAGTFDVRFLVAAAVVMLAASWIESAEAWMDRLPAGHAGALASQVHESIDAVRNGDIGQRTAAVTPGPERVSRLAPEQELADGPRHAADDHKTGMGWYAWYLSEVPGNDEQVSEAYDRLYRNPSDAAARRVLARAAYDAESYDEAAWHYRWLVDRDPADVDLRLRLAWAERRQGYHRAEADLYRDVLGRDPHNQLALGGLAVSLARMNRLDEAEGLLDELQVVAPTSPMTEETVALFEALQGHDKVSLAAMDRAFSLRDQLSLELQLELRRDMATDPALSTLRKDKRLRSMVHRYLGAAGPRPVR